MGIKIRLVRKMKTLRKRGFLTRKQLVLLEEASQRPFKVKKPAQKYSCSDCSYAWFYKSMKCPTCSSDKVAAV
ncbi:MAG: hypothetical protein HY368_01810 [Candidatus Aenigmarchaeota archaeon]|nr:hypothetical protein [Candidatus Aenigmarchaeota archaeon]